MNSSTWLVVLCALAQAAAELPAVVAVVNGREITRQDLERRMEQSRSMDAGRFDRMNEQAKKRALVRILQARVVQELEYQEALAQGVRVPDKEVGLALDRVRRSFPNKEDFLSSLSAGRITVAEWREEFKRALMIARLEEKVSGGLPASEWARRRAEWLQRLREKARVWVWSP